MDYPILSIITIVVFSTFPLLFWAYGDIFLRDHAWNRLRFFGGLFGWALSVGIIMMFETYFSWNNLAILGGLIWVLWLLSVIMLYAIKNGSPYIRWFLYQILWLHFALLVVMIGFWFFGRYMTVSTSIPFLSLGWIVGFFISAYLEEGVKHISSIGLSSRDFRFSRRDLLLFTFFITLGFVMLENILYLIRAYDEGWKNIVFTGLYRLFFALPLHVFAASICVMLWWRALSYRLFSLRYILYFISGFIIATLVHTLYNHLIDGGYFFPLIILTGVGYMAFTQWIIGEEEDVL